MHKNFFIDIITRKPALFAAILRFNGLDIPDKVDNLREVCPNLPQGTLEGLLHNARSRRHLCALAQRREPFWNFAEESHCLALLTPETIADLARFYGAGLHAQDVARTVLGQEVAALRQAMGEDAYAYAMQRGQYQALSGGEMFAARHKDFPLAERIGLHGREALGLITATWPQPLQKCAPMAALSDLSASPNVLSGLWFDMKKILLKEVAPTWAPCFD